MVMGCWLCSCLVLVVEVWETWSISKVRKEFGRFGGFEGVANEIQKAMRRFCPELLYLEGRLFGVQCNIC